MAITTHRGRLVIDLRHTWPNGRQDRIRIRVPNDKLASRKAAAYEQTILAQLRAGIDPRKEEHQPASNEPITPTLAGFEEEFLKASVGRGNKPRYLDAQRQILRDHLVPRFGRTKLDAIGEREIDRFRDDQIAKGLSRKTVRNHLEVLRCLLRVAHRRRLVASVPIVELPKKPPRKINFLSFEEADAFLAAAPVQWRPLFFVVIRTGLRLGEVRGLKWSHLNLDEAIAYVQEQRDDVGNVWTLKSDAARTVNLARDVVEMLRARPRRDALVFPGITDRSAWWFTTSTARRAKLGRHVTFHDLRHSFAAHAVMRGVDVETLRQWLGHASISTTQIYVHVSGFHRRAAADLLAPPRPRLVEDAGGYESGTSRGRKSRKAP